MVAWFVFICNFHLRLWILHIFCAAYFPRNSLFTFSVFQLWRQNEPSVPKHPKIQTEDHPVHHIFSHYLQCCTPSLKTQDQIKLETVIRSEISQNPFLVWKKSEMGWKLVWHKPLVPSEIRSCSPFSTSVMLPIATLSCMTLRLWSLLSMGSWCWDSQTENTWNYVWIWLSFNSSERHTSDS